MTEIQTTSDTLPRRAATGYRLSPAMRLVLSYVRRSKVGRLRLVLPDGRQLVFGRDPTGPQAQVMLHRDRVARRMLAGSTMAFCESYHDGDWSSPDIEELFVWALSNRPDVRNRMIGSTWYRMIRRVGHLLRANTRRGARRNIAQHYDLGNDFYQRWLDPSMTYSSAVFESAESAEGDGAGLAAAQQVKYRRLAESIGLQAGHRVLEIGCGWGGFAEFAAREIGAHVTAITISRSQHDFAAERLRRAGLSGQVDLQLRDYRDVTGQFDRVVSIEMFEAVGERYWPTYFRTVHDRLRPGGQAGLQVITIDEAEFPSYRRGPEYIQRYIFPGGMLPSPSALRKSITEAGLQLDGQSDYGDSYRRTLREWNRRFQAAWPEIRGMGFDDRFKRIWEQYLCYCSAGFRTGLLNVVQVALSRT